MNSPSNFYPFMKHKTKIKTEVKYIPFACPYCYKVAHYSKPSLIRHIKMNAKEQIKATEKSVSAESSIEILRDYVAGVGYSDYQKVLPKLKAGLKLDLTWERKNKFDPNAIRVDFEGTKLGYISKKDNAKIHQYRKGGAKVTCELTAVNHGNPSHTLLCISVKVSTEPPSQTITQGDQKISG